MRGTTFGFAIHCTIYILLSMGMTGPIYQLMPWVKINNLSCNGLHLYTVRRWGYVLLVHWRRQRPSVDPRNFIEVVRASFCDYNQILILIFFRTVRAIFGAKSHYCRSNLWRVTLVLVRSYDSSANLCQLRFLLLSGIGISFQKSERNPFFEIVLATS